MRTPFVAVILAALAAAACGPRPPNVAHAFFGAGNEISATAAIKGPANDRRAEYHQVVWRWTPPAPGEMPESHYLVHSAPDTVTRFADAPRAREGIWNDISVVLADGRVLRPREMTLEFLWRVSTPRHMVRVDEHNWSSEPSTPEQVMNGCSFWTIGESVSVSTENGQVKSLGVGSWFGADRRLEGVRIRSDSAGVEYPMPMSLERLRTLFGPPTMVVEESVFRGW